jgi:kynurenine formamidase
MDERHLLLTVLLLAGCSQHDDHTKSPSLDSPQATAAAVASFPTGRLIDLTHPFDEQTIYWPTESGFLLERGNNGVTEKGYYYAANRFRAAEHGGTHVDAPIHFFDQRHTVEQIELQRLLGEAAVIDVSAKCQANRDYEISVSDLRAWEEAQGRQLVDLIVLLRTGWSRRWPDREAYLGTSGRGPEAVADLHFPGLSAEAARWLAESRSPKAVGIDTASIDHGQATHFPSHIVLCEHNIPGFENISNLDQLPQQGAYIVALPMKIAGGSGAPLRILAILPATP